MIGCGNIGTHAETDPVRPKPATHAGAWLTHPQVDLLAVADTDFPQAKAAGLALGVPYSFDDAAQMVGQMGPAIVSVATPVSTHAALVAVVCRASGQVKAIICEKPMASSSAEGQGMVDLCRARGVRLFVNHGRRFDPILRAEAAKLDKIVGVPRSAVGWYSGGLREGGTHMVDLMRMFLGEAEVVGSSGGDALLRFAPGVRGALLGHDLAEHAIFELVVTGREGRLILARAGLDIRWERATEGYPLASGYRQLAPNGSWRDPEPRSFLGAMADHVVAVLDGLEDPVSTGADGVAALKIIEAIEAG